MSNLIINSPDDYPKMQMILKEISNTSLQGQKPKAYKSCCATEIGSCIPQQRPPDIVKQLSELRVAVPEEDVVISVKPAPQDKPWYTRWLGL